MERIIAARDVWDFVYRQIRRKPILFAIVSCLLVKRVTFYIWGRHIFKIKIQERQRKAQQRKSAVERQLGPETDVGVSGVEMTAAEIVRILQEGSLSAVQVLHAFQRKALEVTKEINCVVEPIEEAEAQARELDASSTKSGLLHGLPISVKENINITGYDSTAGLSVDIGQLAVRDAVVIQVLKKHGAIPFVRTNIPQSMFSYCCSNPLYGETLNPLDTQRCPGGSSGGEGAILAAGASVVGIGTDIGGSLRIPAAFCGVYALKPTCGRISSQGLYSLSRGNLAIQGVVGPMARDLESLLLLSRALMSTEMLELDRQLPPLPFNEKLFETPTKLRIGFYAYDGVCQCQPSVVRAVMEAKQALERRGHEVVAFDFPSIMGSGFPQAEFYIPLVLPDRGRNLKTQLGYDDAEPAVQTIIRLGQSPKLFLKFGEVLVRSRDKMSASLLRASTGFPSVYAYCEHICKFKDWQESFLKAWTDEKLDAVICPVFPSPAVTRTVIPFVSACGTYCQMYNSLNYPAAVAPVTKVTQEDLDLAFNLDKFKPSSVVEKLLLKSSIGSASLPVSVQCVALPFQDEVCLKVVSEIKQGLLPV